MTNTVYAYDAVGNLTNVTYQSSHALTFAYDALNRMASMSDAIGTTTFTYTPGYQLASEDGPWASDTISYTYTDRLRTALDLQQPNASAWAQSYIYDLAGRMTGTTSPAGTFSYTYNPGVGGVNAASSLVGKIVLPSAAWITNTYDNNGRMLGTWLTNSTSNLDSSVYTYNVGNQRTQVTRTGENTAAYTYDVIGQVLGDQASEVSGGAARMNEQLHYAFDPAGNLKYRTNNTLTENFQVNTVNELTANTNGGKLTVMGTTTSAATNVAVNGTNALRYGDATFAATNMPLTTTYTAAASDSLGRHSTNTVTVSIATNTSYQYDGNGNLTNDGLRSFAYDNENQLLQVWVPNQWFSQFAYDGKMRRRIRQEYTWQSGAWVQTNEVYYVYDGNLVIQERNINNLPTTTYTRGLDLAASLDGAGGIGGLLSMTLNTAPGPSSSNSMYYHSDGNGNVTMLLNPWQYIVAKYLYDAFGNTLSAAGSLAQANLYRFSSKEAHPNSGLVYYLYRYYDPNLQRWPNRDPIQELGGVNLYAILGGNLINGVDPYGLLVIITTSNGKVIYVWTTLQLLNAITSQSNGSILQIDFAGHGNSCVQGISDTSACLEQLDLLQGVPCVNGPSIDNAFIPIGPILAGKMATQGQINLGGCQTAGQNGSDPNVCQALSSVLPGVCVSGSTMTTFVHLDSLEPNTHYPFTINTYYTPPLTLISAPGAPSFNTVVNVPNIFAHLPQ